MIKVTLDESAIKKVLAASGPEVKVDLQRGIVQGFVTRHLKGIANEEITRVAVNAVQKEVSKRLSEEIGSFTTKNFSNKVFTFSPTMEKLVKDKVKCYVRTELRDTIRTMVKQAVEEADIQTMVKEKTDAEALKTLNKEVEARWQKVVKSMNTVLAKEE